MFELLAEVFASCWRLLKAELPDCVLILNEIRSGRRTVAPASKGYLWLCNLTAASSLLRISAVAWFVLAVGNLLLHFQLKWPPFDFKDIDRHLLFWGLSFTSSSPSISPLHFCYPLAVATMTSFVATTISYYGAARLLREFAGIVCPVSEPISQPAKTNRKRRKNEVA